MRLHLSLPQLAAFTTLARQGSFRDAATETGVSQPAFSRTIQTIEARLGARLFDRDTHRVSLTPAGQKLLPLVQDLLSNYQACFDEFESFVSGRGGAIRIAVIPSVAATLLPGTLAAFSAEHPEIEIELWEDVGAPIHQAVRDGQVDFGIAPPPIGEDLAFQLLFKDELLLLAPDGDPLLAEPQLDWTVFAERPFIGLSSETGLRALVDEALTAAGVTRKPVFVCKQPTTLASFVAAGTGIAALTRLTFAQLSNDALGATKLHPTYARPVGLITHTRRSLSPAVRLFTRELAEQARRFQASGF